MEQTQPIYFDGSKQEALEATANQVIQMDESIRRIISGNPYPYINISKHEE